MISSKPNYIFCPKCKNSAWTCIDHGKHLQGSGVDHVQIEGVFIAEDFISPEQENELVDLIDKGDEWIASQEGRFKQDFGPKVSFLKKKVSVGNFNGFPDFANILLSRAISNHQEQLANFIPVEFCILEYTPERGSYIRPHYDDKWIWGDRLVTINLLSSTYLRLTKEFYIPPYEILIEMPPRSLLIIFGEARYDWHHSINRYDIKSRRVAMTWREFGDEILHEKEHKNFVDEVFTIANKSWNSCRSV